MPAMCFSYPPDIRPGIGNRNIAQPDLRNPRMMPTLASGTRLTCHAVCRFPASATRKGLTTRLSAAATATPRSRMCLACAACRISLLPLLSGHTSI